MIEKRITKQAIQERREMKGGSVMVGVAFLVMLGSAEAVIVGGWKPIEDLKDPHVREIAEFAVAEYDKRSGEGLKLSRIVKGETQVVSGTNYRLVLALLDGTRTHNYQAVVWEKPWLKFRNLTSFEPLKV